MWRLRTFGGLSITTDGSVGTAATRRRPLALLALLAAAGERELSREKVVALLWPESDAEHGRNSLSQALASLRRDMAGDDPVTGAAELRLNPLVITSDVAEFERSIASGAHERAVALYQGAFLDGFYVRDAAEFERWADEQRRRFHDVYAGTLLRLARAADERSDREGAVAWWRRLAALEPTSAQATSGLMRALATIGDPAGARRHYRVYEQLMHQEFGVPPEPAVTALASSLFTEFSERPVPVLGAATSVAKVSDDPQRARELVPVSAIATPSVVGGVGPPVVSRRPLLAKRAAVAGAMFAIAILAVAGGLVAARVRGAEDRANGAAHRVVIRTFRNSSGDPALDPIGLMAADWIARGLTETPSVDVAGTESEIASKDVGDPRAATMTPIELGRLTHARYVISGSYTTQGDSLVFQPEVTDVEAERRVLPIEPVGEAIRTKQAALERLRQRVMGALVPFFDSSVVTESRVPPRYEAYREFLLGDQIYNSDLPAAIGHLRIAARLDSTFVFTRLRLISGLTIMGATAARDSVIAQVEAMRNSLSPFEAAAFDGRVALARNDLHGAYVASQNARQLAPKSTWAAYEAGEVALVYGRANEAVRLFEGLDPESGSLRFHPVYYTLLCRAYYALARVGDMRRCYERARRQHPNARLMLGYLLRVPGALRDADQVEQLVDSVLADSNQFLVAALFELEAHGRKDRAEVIAQHALARTQRSSVDSTRATELLDTRLGLLMFLANWRELGRLADSTLQRRPSHWAFVLGGVASAMVGDTAEARRRVRSLGAYSRDGARILAALGDKRAALEILQRIAAPARWWQYHDDLIYRLMRGYPPFEAFLKTTD